MLRNWNKNSSMQKDFSLRDITLAVVLAHEIISQHYWSFNLCNYHSLFISGTLYVDREEASSHTGTRYPSAILNLTSDEDNTCFQSFYHKELSELYWFPSKVPYRVLLFAASSESLKLQRQFDGCWNCFWFLLMAHSMSGSPRESAKAFLVKDALVWIC